VSVTATGTADDGSDDNNTDDPGDPGDPGDPVDPGACTSAFTSAGQTLFGMFGIYVGSQVGVVVGGVAGTVVEPGGGTVIGGIGGGVVGGGIGGYAGYNAGGAVGGWLGSILCYREHDSNQTPSNKPPHQKGKTRKRRDFNGRPNPPRKRPKWWPIKDGPWPPPPGQWPPR
jgi:hypothetical protein